METYNKITLKHALTFLGCVLLVLTGSKTAYCSAKIPLSRATFLSFSNNRSRFPTSCSHEADLARAWGLAHRPAMDSWLQSNGIVLINLGMNDNNLADFAVEYGKLPESLRQKIVSGGGSTHLLQGHGVAEDPTWRQGFLSTFDGRNWDTVPGAGGFPYLGVPTRIVINRLYEGNGSINMVLHETAHSLDSLQKQAGISNSQAWRILWRENPRFIRAMRDHCGNYCVDHPQEAFAETVALFYSCQVNHENLEQEFPAMARFLNSLEKDGLL